MFLIVQTFFYFKDIFLQFHQHTTSDLLPLLLALTKSPTVMNMEATCVETTPNGPRPTVKNHVGFVHVSTIL